MILLGRDIDLLIESNDQFISCVHWMSMSNCSD